jgi:hypothetical protein
MSNIGHERNNEDTVGQWARIALCHGCGCTLSAVSTGVGGAGVLFQ